MVGLYGSSFELCPVVVGGWWEKSACVKKLVDGEMERILFEDESMIRDDQALGRTGFPKGQQKKIPTDGKHWGDKWLGTLDYETGEVVCEHAEHDTAVKFLDRLKTIVTRYAGENIVMVLDHAAIHHAKLIQPFLEEHRNHLTWMFLPPDSPQLNLIEGVWGWLKRSVIYNVFFRSVKAIMAAVTTFIERINKNLEFRTPKVSQISLM
ncbi:MAG: IS630 family transposase [Firmicutes bacterium]|nr:IS630 family transposase [Bacillota bacterium]MCL5064432.1 IS630 family transposase [Bacillota bacterium]